MLEYRKMGKARRQNSEDPVEYEIQRHSTGQAGDRISKAKDWNHGTMEDAQRQKSYHGNTPVE
jgi:hypothetical protein